MNFMSHKITKLTFALQFKGKKKSISFHVCTCDPAYINCESYGAIWQRHLAKSYVTQEISGLYGWQFHETHNQWTDWGSCSAGPDRHKQWRTSWRLEGWVHPWLQGPWGCGVHVSERSEQDKKKNHKPGLQNRRVSLLRDLLGTVPCKTALLGDKEIKEKLDDLQGQHPESSRTKTADTWASIAMNTVNTNFLSHLKCE